MNPSISNFSFRSSSFKLLIHYFRLSSISRCMIQDVHQMVHDIWYKSSSTSIQDLLVNPTLKQRYVHSLCRPWSEGWWLIQHLLEFYPTHRSRSIQSFIIQIPLIGEMRTDVCSLRWCSHPYYPPNVSMNSLYVSMIIQQRSSYHSSFQ